MKKLTFLMLCLFLTINLWSQSAERPIAVGVNLGVNQFWGNAGNAFMKFDPLNTMVGISGRLYADNNFDYSLNADFGKIGFKRDGIELFNGNIQMVSFKAHYKFYNGYILKENAMIGPFLTVGGGLAWHKGTDYWKNHNAVILPVGAGVNFRLTEAWAVQLQSLLNFSLHNPYRNTDYGYTVDDKFFTTTIGAYYSLGKCCKKGEKAIKPEISKAPVVSEETKKIFEQALQGVQFETGKDVIKAESFPILDNVVSVMKNNPEYKLEINGHTDNQGDAKMNLDLSNRRANAVKKYLTEKGVAENRMKAQGFGQTMPVADNTTAEGRAKNRRVEFKVANW
jgi:outer membrane protein OmpA-like peptidoglycan-associated protein